MYSASKFKGADIAIEAIRLARQQLPHLQTPPLRPDKMPSPTCPSPPTPTGPSAPNKPSSLKSYDWNCDAPPSASRIEGFGLPLLEATACRTPVIGEPPAAAAPVSFSTTDKR